MADGFEPGCTAREVAAVFGPLRARLQPLLDAVRGASRRPDGAFNDHPFDVAAQERLGEVRPAPAVAEPPRRTGLLAPPDPRGQPGPAGRRLEPPRPVAAAEHDQRTDVAVRQRPRGQAGDERQRHVVVVRGQHQHGGPAVHGRSGVVGHLSPPVGRSRRGDLRRHPRRGPPPSRAPGASDARCRRAG
ncbi:MAG: hypothetical protein ACKOGJ_06015, partial [Phycisphaerales bacterium]